MKRLFLYTCVCALSGGIIGALAGYLVGAEVLGSDSSMNLKWYVRVQGKSAIELAIGLTIIGALIGLIVATTRSFVERGTKPRG